MSLVKERNIEMDILKGLGIIMVVMGHYYIPFSWFTPYSFHMPLFFFASGYFYNAKYESDFFLLIKKRAKSLLLPYFLYSIVLGVFELLIYHKNNAIHLFADPSPFTPYNFFVLPFIQSQQSALFLPGWFMTQLFIVSILFPVIYKYLKKITTNMYVHLVIFLFVAFLGTHLALNGWNAYDPNVYKTIVSRTLFAIAFYFLGIFYRYITTETKINIFQTKYLVLMFIVQIFIMTKYGNIHFYMVSSDYLNNRIVPIIASIDGIYLFVFFSRMLSQVLKETDMLVKIGQNSLHILALQLTVFFIVNVIWIKYRGADITVLKEVYYRENQEYWLVYVGLAILVPTYGAILIKYLINTLTNRNPVRSGVTNSIK